MMQRSLAVVVDQAKQGLTSSSGKKTGSSRQHRRGSTVPASVELEQALKKLQQLRKRKVESEIAKDFEKAADLVNYAIPDQKDTVRALEKKVIEQEGIGFRHPEVETESESSDRDHLPPTNGRWGF